ncbi:AbrB/MazE/SpoVT family DNA-binding domain-containing protein [Candidatus Woesearchaeota archaeon]|nr:AbrB/MazE/SpoVT family DNA-binding domain-containing protein [Candidatus Woesearchaeota archaeon]
MEKRQNLSMINDIINNGDIKMLTNITEGFQITIPAKIRKIFGLGKGSLIDIELNEKKKEIIIKPVNEMSLEEAFARADSFKEHSLTPEDLEKMEDEIYN